ncbi:exo-alpha-sialidase [Azoarcus sp. DD4]|uniref:sialidase family protein n=1 Tax=Azoarcus sp. DD4 TaxID=2027405 RepID=UPI00143DD550|nr:sialidase family protein [Azoarcus sp. DD4]
MSGHKGRAGRAAALALIAVVTAWAAWPGLRTAAPAGFVAPQPFAAAASAGVQATPRLVSAIVNEAEPPRVHAASIAALPDGRLFATWFGGEREGGTEVKIYGAFRAPGAVAWETQQVIASPEQTSADVGRLVRKMGNPLAFVTPAGELWVVYVSVTMGGWATSHLNLLRSPDLGRSWLPAQRLVASPFLNLSTLVKGYPVSFDNGDIGLPVYHEMAGKFAELLVLSAGGEVRRKQRIDHGRRSLQPVVLVQDAQRAVALMRYGGEQAPFRAWRSETADGGRSWSAVEATDLANPNSALAALRLEDGRLLAVANDTDDERLRLSLLVSADEGRHWRVIHRFEDKQALAGKELDEPVFRALLEQDVDALGAAPAREVIVRNTERNLCRGNGPCGWQYDYPYLVRAADGDFHLVYTWNRSFVRHLQFNRAWLEGKL